MKLLSFDTSAEALSVAVAVNGSLIKTTHGVRPLRHSSALVPAIEQLLRDSKMRIQDIDVFAVGVGPGSFTGIRVAVVTAKMLAYALDKKIVAVSSLEAIARSVLSDECPKVAVCLDARRSMAYTAAYELVRGKVKNTAKPAIKPQAENVLFEKKGYRVVTQGQPEARFVAEAGHELAKNKKYISPQKLAPDYLHPRDVNVTVKK